MSGPYRILDFVDLTCVDFLYNPIPGPKTRQTINEQLMACDSLLSSRVMDVEEGAMAV